MNSLITEFLLDQTGQDLIEYSLLLAFVALASGAVFTGVGSSVGGVWTAANSRLSKANTVAS
jgi:Flp pilus assembly pilin Flp